MADKRKRNVAALGALTILAVAVFFWGFYYLLGNPVFKGGMDVVVALDHGAGIKRGDRVLLQGVNVGSVKDVKLAGARGVIVTLRLNDRLPLPADTRARVHGTRIKGLCTLSVKEGGSGQAQGEALLASQGGMNLIKLIFESEENPTWFKFDGNKIAVSQIRPGRRTSLENFFAAYEGLIKEGLFGGILSEAWPLFKVKEKNPKLENSGIKEVNGKKLIAIKYSPHKGSEMKIVLFFEPETFRHVRTEYNQTIYATDQQRIGSTSGLPAPREARATNARIVAYEEFSNFKEEQGLNLPHTYVFDLNIQSDIRPAIINWKLELAEFKFDAPFEQAEATGPKN